MIPWGVLAGVLFSEDLMQSKWFADLSTFVSINTVAFVTLAVIKTLPKAYLSDWIDRRDRRTESRSIYPDLD